MPDFSTEGAQKFWDDRRDYALCRIIASLEGVENWTLDNHAEFEEAINRLGDVLEAVEGFELAQEDRFISILLALKSGRALRILQHIDRLQPGSASKLLIYAEVASSSPEDVPGFFLKRNLVFERLQLLGRIFAPERFALVTRALEKAER